MKQKDNYKLWTGIAIGLTLGLCLGMFIQQILFVKSVEGILDGSLDGTNFNVELNLNETKLIQELNKTIPREEINCDCQEDNFVSKNCTWDYSGRSC